MMMVINDGLEVIVAYDDPRFEEVRDPTTS
jgi:hypothetical protein